MKHVVDDNVEDNEKKIKDGFGVELCVFYQTQCYTRTTTQWGNPAALTVQKEITSFIK